jgi:hypothetical protein
MFARVAKLLHPLWIKKSHQTSLSGVLQIRLGSYYLCPLSFAPPESGVFYLL